MKERPILFSGEMVRAILDGRKTQTRRVVKTQPEQQSTGWAWRHRQLDAGHCHTDLDAMVRLMEPLCPHGQPGDRLWVREAHLLDPPHDGTWGYYDYTDGAIENISAIPKRFRNPKHVLYRASDDKPETLRWRPSIHMPRWASRIALEVTGVRVERLHDISEEDAKAEGVSPTVFDEFDIAELVTNEPESVDAELLKQLGPGQITAKTNFAMLWDEINGKKHPWASNPWVWVVSFRRVV